MAVSTAVLACLSPTVVVVNIDAFGASQFYHMARHIVAHEPAPAAPATDNMDVDAPPAAETPAAAPAADEEGSDAVGAVGVPAAAPAPAQAPAAETPPAPALADLVVQVDEASAVASPFSQMLLKVARAARLVEGELSLIHI